MKLLQFFLILFAAGLSVSAQPGNQVLRTPFAYNRSVVHAETDSTIESPGATIRYIKFVNADQEHIPACYVVPIKKDGKLPLLVFQHWGYSRKNEFVDEAVQLAAEGFASILIDAPWYSPDQRFHFPQDLSDTYLSGVKNISQGIDLMSSLSFIDTGRIAYIGHSYGAFLGIYLGALDGRIKAMVLMSGAASMAEILLSREYPYWNKLRDSVPDKYGMLLQGFSRIDGYRYLPLIKQPVLLQFGLDDTDIHLADARKLDNLLRTKATARYYKAGHGLNDEARSDRDTWLKDQLKRRDK